jgi:hypothetical protein
MKHITRILLLAVTLVTGLKTVSAQTVVLDIRQKVATLPATLTNYIDDPFRYFDVTFFVSGAGEEGVDVYLDIDFTSDATPFYARTRAGSYPAEPLNLKNGLNRTGKDELWFQVRNGRVETNANYNNLLDVQLLPEGTYQFCVKVNLWTDRYNPNPEPIANACPTFQICYSGSAPEMVSPMASANLALNGAGVVVPSRKVHFNWTPVISNCATSNVRFNYKLKVVRVIQGQNYQDAIKFNPTVFSAEVRNGTHVVLDTLRDIKVLLQRGALYVAQVQAEPIVTSSRSSVDFEIANDGNSQPMPFFWDVPAEGSWAGMLDSTGKSYGSIDDEEEREESEISEGIDGRTQWEGGAEEVSELDEILEEAIPDEPSIVLEPKRHYVESDGYYTIPMKDNIEVGLKPLKHKSLKDVTYTIALYENKGGDMDEIIASEPLMSESMETLPESRTFTGWDAKLEQGNLYYLRLTNSFTVSYMKYVIADTTYYVNEMFAEHIHDTVSRVFVEERMESSNGVFFQWGDDPKAPAFATPQWQAPVSRTNDDIYDPANYKAPTTVPEIQKNESFPISWTPVKNVTPGDVVEYEVNVYELKPGQTLEEAVSSNKVLVTRTVTNVSAISEQDPKFFKVFSAQKTYVMTLSTTVKGKSDTVYHFANGNEAIPVVFKVVK